MTADNANAAAARVIGKRVHGNSVAMDEPCGLNRIQISRSYR